MKDIDGWFLLILFIAVFTADAQLNKWRKVELLKVCAEHDIKTGLCFEVR